MYSTSSAKENWKGVAYEYREHRASSYGRAVYNRMNKDMIDYDKRMDIILGQLKDEFREQAI